MFALKPDIIVGDDIVVDTKWKPLDPAKATLGVAQSDVYQMLAYARAYSAKRVVLLYPWRKGLPEAGVCRQWFTPDDVPFDIATVDIGDAASVASSLRRVVAGPADRGRRAA